MPRNVAAFGIYIIVPESRSELDSALLSFVSCVRHEVQSTHHIVTCT